MSSLQEIQQTQPKDHELIDIKLPDSEMESAWQVLKHKRPFALAGGLHAENVARAVEICRPEWIDVARGVEIEPGKKDRDKMKKFIQAVRTA